MLKFRRKLRILTKNGWLKMILSKNADPNQIIIQLQFKLGITLFFKLEYFKYIVLIKILLWSAFLMGYDHIQR